MAQNNKDIHASSNKQSVNNITKMMNIEWSKSNNYTIDINYGSSFAENVKWDFEKHGRDINLYVMAVNTPDITYSGIDTVVSGQKRFAQGLPNDLTFSITFADSDQMELYTRFLMMQQTQSAFYFEDYAGTYTITKEADYVDAEMTEKGRTVIVLEDCAIVGVSNLSINNAQEATVAQFTVRFKALSMYINN